MSATVEDVHPVRTITVTTTSGSHIYRAHAVVESATGGLEVMVYVKDSLFIVARFPADGWLLCEANAPFAEDVSRLEYHIRASAGNQARQQVRPVTPDEVLNNDDLPAAFRNLLK